MTPEKWQELKELCHLALEQDPEQRGAFLAAVCPNDEPLRRQAESMIARATTGRGILSEPFWEKLGIEAAAVKANPSEMHRQIPPLLGRYRLVRMIGAGGMGVVYEAEQDHPRRTVALKVIKPGPATPELLRRFELESQVLARLHHPAIAQIYEADAADAGFGPQPYFAMEFIHGEPLTEYAASNHLNRRQRLNLMANVCDAVEHAHQHGVIHRDLKPGNILVEQTGQPKILDFGVARATDSDTRATKQTDVGQLIGTLAYMSPEQTVADPLELDTRSDVYALGVILYELLAERLPYQVSHHLHEAVRAIQQDDPTPLSSISRVHRGDVETIVGKALEKDKTHRYESAAAFAADIRRYLADEPIAARPASLSYHLQKFARRHRALVTATAVVLVVLVAGIAVSTREAVTARQAEQTAEAVNDFLQNDLLAQASAVNQSARRAKPDPELKVRTALDRAAARVAGKFERQPEVEAAVRDTIGQTYMDLGLYPEARKQLERALDLRRRVLGPENPKTFGTLAHIGYTAFLQAKYPEAEALFSQTLMNQRHVLGFEHPETLNSMNNLANVYKDEGKYTEAEKLQSQTLEIRRRVLGAEHPETLASMTNLSSVYYLEGKSSQAEALYRRTLEICRRVLGPEDLDTLECMNNLADLYDDQGKYAQAEALFTQILQIRRRELGAEHPDTLTAMNNLALDFISQGKYARAEALGSESLELERRVLGPEHPDTLKTMNGLAFVRYAQGRYAQAEALFGQTLEISRRVLGPEHRDTIAYMDNLATALGGHRKYRRAEALFQQTLEISRRVLGPEHSSTLALISNLAFMYQRECKYDLAKDYATQVLAGRRHSLESENPDTMASAGDLALAYVSLSEFANSEPLAREILEFNRKKQPDDWQRFRAESLLGASLAGQRRYGEAEPLLVDGYQGMLARKDRMTVPDRYHIERARGWLLQLYNSTGKREKAVE